MRLLLYLFALSSTALFAQTPILGGIYNNYSRASGNIAQGSIFIVQGKDLSDKTTGLQDVTAGGLQTTLEGVRLKVTVGQTSAYAPLYYVLPDQLAGIMPSTLPEGNGNVVVENNGRISAPSVVSFRVAKRRLGVLAWDALPDLGRGIVQDKNYVLLGQNNATRPGEVIVFYGSGLGPVKPGVDESTMQIGVNASGNMTEILFSANIGGKDAPVEYRGRTIYPGLDQINIRVPTLNANDYGCDVPVVITTDGVVANAVTIPVTTSGTTCVPLQVQGVANPNLLPTVNQVGDWISAGWFRRGVFTFSRNYSNMWALESFTAPFARIPTIQRLGASSAVNSSLFGASTEGTDTYDEWLTYEYTSKNPAPQPGTCVYAPPANFPPNVNGRGLDGGVAIVMTTPSGVYTARRSTVNGVNFSYEGLGFLSPFVPGRYLFKVMGGTEVNAFTGFLDIGPDFVLTNPGDLELEVVRNQGKTIRWTGGGTALVTITGQSAGQNSTFVCWEQASAGQFTIPASLLSQLTPSVMDGQRMLSTSSLVVSAEGPGNRMTPPEGLDLLTANVNWRWSFTPQYK